ncbi:MAG: hydrogen peroxide-dependent heme synthase [Candidatus Nanopelagicales bacterium]
MSESAAPANPPGDDTRYTCWAVYRRVAHQPAALMAKVERLTTCLAALEARDVVVRGLYDLSAMRGDADLMVWVHTADPATLQVAARELRSALTGAGELTWSAVGVHRAAEFNRGHVPAFLTGERPREWLALYPFVRSYEWYLLPAAERREMLAEHGRMGREYPSVLGNTVASFGLGDWEWLLGLESDELLDIVDLMRHLRASAARRHVREEVPFYTGRRLAGAAAAIEVLT